MDVVGTSRTKQPRKLRTWHSVTKSGRIVTVLLQTSGPSTLVHMILSTFFSCFQFVAAISNTATPHGGDRRDKLPDQGAKLRASIPVPDFQSFSKVVEKRLFSCSCSCRYSSDCHHVRVVSALSFQNIICSGQSLNDIVA